jgi:hypothetical protein
MFPGLRSGKGRRVGTSGPFPVTAQGGWVGRDDKREHLGSAPGLEGIGHVELLDVLV